MFTVGNYSSVLHSFFSDPSKHTPHSSEYCLYQDSWDEFLTHSFSTSGRFSLSLYGHQFVFPSYTQGNTKSHELLGFHELLVFMWYIIFKKYRNCTDAFAADIGANIGFHSMFLSKLGFNVDAFEPESTLSSQFYNTLDINSLSGSVNLVNKPVTSDGRSVEFVRVLDNPPASYISGYKSGYGPLDCISMPSVPIGELASRSKLVKIDAEGSETEIITAIPRECWDSGLIVFFEISRPAGRQAIFDYANRFDLGIYPQLSSWHPVSTYTDLPSTWREGNCIITKDSSFIQLHSKFIQEEEVF